MAKLDKRTKDEIIREMRRIREMDVVQILDNIGVAAPQWVLASGFLHWCKANDRSFGYGNVDAVFDEYQAWDNKQKLIPLGANRIKP